MPKVTHRFDFLSPPILYGAMYLLLFGLEAIDIAFVRGSGAYRVGNVFIDFQGISPGALAYVWFGFALFAFGYYLPVGRVIARKFSTARITFKPQRASFVTAAMFIIAYVTVILYSQQYGYVRRSITEESDPASFLLIVGDLALIAFSLGIWRFMLSKRPNGPALSKRAVFFVWGIMLPLLAILYTLGGTRVRLGYLVVIILLSYHYGYRRLKLRPVFISALILFGVLLPTVARLRAGPDDVLAAESDFAGFGWIWDSLMRRTSGLEGFIVTWENLDRAPEPPPVWMSVASIIPRVLWSDKPFSDWSERFSAWASNIPGAQLTPTLPGELLLQFGYLGGLVAMLGLGILWRILFVAFIGYQQQPFASGFVYICLLTLSLQALEGGFVIEYGALLRFLVVSVIVMWVIGTRRVKSTQLVQPHEQPGGLQIDVADHAQVDPSAIEMKHRSFDLSNCNPGKLHLGCGPVTPDGWINLDGSWNAWFAKHTTLRGVLKVFHLAPTAAFDFPWSSNVLVHDVRKGLPFEDDSLSAIYSSHMLEHLYLEEATRLLSECCRVLVPGGVLRLVVPDLEALVAEYVKPRSEESIRGMSAADTVFPADRLNQQLLLRNSSPPRGNPFFRLYALLQDFHSHKWMYDSDSLIGHFERAGFVDVRRKEFRQSQIEDIESVETANRVLGGAGICVEGIKPTNSRTRP